MSAVIVRADDRARLVVTGRDRLPFLHNMTTQDIQSLLPGDTTTAAMVDQRAAILDVFEVVVHDDEIWLVGGAGKATEDLAWLDRYLITEDVQLVDAGDKTAVLLVVGDGAAAIAGHNGKPGHQHDVNLGRVPMTAWLATGFEGAYLWLAADDMAAALRDLADRGATLASPEEAESRRIAAGAPVVPNELVAPYNPWEAGLDKAISLDKGCYLGQEVVARLRTYDKVQRKLIGLEPHDGAAPTPGQALHLDGKAVGVVTSVAPGTGDWRAMGYVKRILALPGTLVSYDGGTARIRG